MFQAWSVGLPKSLVRRGSAVRWLGKCYAELKYESWPMLVCSMLMWCGFINLPRLVPCGAEPHQLRGLMSGGRPPVGSSCGITGVLTEPGERRTIWAEAKGRARPCRLGRTMAEGRMAASAEPGRSAEPRRCIERARPRLGSLAISPRFGVGRSDPGRTKGWLGQRCA